MGRGEHVGRVDYGPEHQQGEGLGQQQLHQAAGAGEGGDVMESKAAKKAQICVEWVCPMLCTSLALGAGPCATTWPRDVFYWAYGSQGLINNFTEP